MWTAVLLELSMLWCRSNLFMAKTMGLQKGWHIDPIPEVSRSEWLFVTCNHQSWVDPFIVAETIVQKCSPFKIFIKDILKYMPVLGIVFMALEYPRLKRYSKDTLKKKPHLRGKDVETTKKFINKALERPTTVFSFIEGTRFTSKKHQKQNSPYKHLLMPKPGGFALTISALKGHINHFLHYTIVYDEKKSFWDYLCGRVRNVKVFVEKVEIPEAFFHADYQQDEQYRSDLKTWLNDIWAKTDKKMTAALS